MAGPSGGGGFTGKGSAGGGGVAGGNAKPGGSPRAAFHHAAGGGGGNRGGNRGGRGGGGNAGRPGVRGSTITGQPGRGMGFGQLGKLQGWKQAGIIGQALAQAEYGPTIAEDRHMLGINNRQGRAAEALTAGYYKQLGRFTQQGLQQERQISQNMRGQLGTIGSQTQQQLGQIDQNAVQGLRSYTPQGTPGDLTTRAPALNALSTQLAQQKGLSAQDTQAFRQGGVMQGANYKSLAASNLGTNSLFGEQQLGEIAQNARLANEPLIAQIAGLRAKKGALAAADTAKWRQQQIANNLTSQGLGLKSQALNITAANDKARNQLTLRAQNLDNYYRQQEIKLGLGRLTEQQRHNLVSEAIAKAHANASGSGKTTPLTTHENDAMQALLDAAAHYLSPGTTETTGTGSKAHKVHVTLGDLQSGRVKGFPPNTPYAILQAAYELANAGYITPAQLAALHKLGMTHVTYRGTHVKVGSPSSVTKGSGGNFF